MGLFVFSERRIKVLIKYSSNVSSDHALLRLCGWWEKGRWFLPEKYFSIKFRLTFQLANSQSWHTSTYGSTIKNAFSKIILPRLKALVFLLFNVPVISLSVLQQSSKFHKWNLFLASLPCSSPPTTFKKGTLIYTQHVCHQTLV